METTTLAVDLAKDVFQVACANRAGRIHTRRRLTRGQFAELLATTPAGTEVVMDACGSAHYWARQAQAHGPAVRLLPVRYVRDDRKLQQGLLTQCPLCDPDLAHQHSLSGDYPHDAPPVHNPQLRGLGDVLCQNWQWAAAHPSHGLRPPTAAQGGVWGTGYGSSSERRWHVCVSQCPGWHSPRPR